MRQIIKGIFFSGLLMSLATISFAEGKNAVPATHESSFNPVMIGLVAVIVILLFAIGVLSTVLKQLAIVYRDKLRAERSKNNIVKAVIIGAMLLLPATRLLAQGAADTATTIVTKIASSPFISGIPKTEFYALMCVIVLELIIVVAIMFHMRILLRALSNKPELAEEVEKAIKKVPFWDRINAVVPMEKEADITIDHDYDGIRELDNSLPPWWKYGFYLTIIVAVAYLWYYHGGGSGPSSHDEYVAAMQKGEEEKQAYLALNAGNIDENNVTVADAAGIEDGKTLFSKNCAACHAPDGGGIVGPNLTDNYWLHGGGLKDVFKSIKYGWQDKGMKSWKDDFSPKQLQSLASFVKSLNGTKPAAPKEKQGELYVEESGPSGADSTKAERSKVVAVQ